MSLALTRCATCGADLHLEIEHIGRTVHGRYVPPGTLIPDPRHVCRPNAALGGLAVLVARAGASLPPDPAAPYGRCVLPGCNQPVPQPAGQNKRRTTCSLACQRALGALYGTRSHQGALGPPTHCAAPGCQTLVGPRPRPAGHARRTCGDACQRRLAKTLGQQVGAGVGR